MILLNGREQRSKVPFRCLIHVRAGCDQYVNDLGLAQPSSQDKWGVSTRAAVIWIDSVFDQPAHTVDIVASNRVQNRRIGISRSVVASSRTSIVSRFMQRRFMGNLIISGLLRGSRMRDLPQRWDRSPVECKHDGDHCAPPQADVTQVCNNPNNRCNQQTLRILPQFSRVCCKPGD